MLAICPWTLGCSRGVLATHSSTLCHRHLPKPQSHRILCSRAPHRQCRQPCSLSALQEPTAGQSARPIWRHSLAQALAACLACTLLTTGARADVVSDSSSALAGNTAGAASVLEEQQEQALRDTKQAPPDKVFLSLTAGDGLGGRISVRLFKDAPVGATRFAALAKGKQGVGYARSQIDGIAKGFISSSGVRSLNYSSQDDSDFEELGRLEAELQESKHGHKEAGVVSLLVKNAQPRQVKEKLVAYQGKLITVKEELGELPNGTAFSITLAPAPELDSTQLPIGQVVEGSELISKVAGLPHVASRENSPFFQLAKAIGDGRAATAAKGFGRPYTKVYITECGIS